MPIDQDQLDCDNNNGRQNELKGGAEPKKDGSNSKLKNKNKALRQRSRSNRRLGVNSRSNSDTRLRKQDNHLVEPIGNTIYQFKVKNLKGREVSMDRYIGHPVLIVNTASKDMMLSTKNFLQLNKLFINYSPAGFCIAAFPSNDFGSEPLSNKEIEEYNDKMEIKFDFYAKVEVNGKNESPLFTWLKAAKGGLLFNAVKYNFTKFLIDRHGVPFRRYSPLTDPDTIEPDIKALLP